MEQRKILVMDDEPGLVASVATVLNGNSCCVVVASDGDEGLQKVIEERPDLIILDAVTPVKHTLKFCQELRTDDRYRLFRHIPILLTFYPIEPFDPGKLLERVGNSIDIAQPKKQEAAIYVKKDAPQMP